MCFSKFPEEKKSKMLQYGRISTICRQHGVSQLKVNTHFSTYAVEQVNNFVYMGAIISGDRKIVMGPPSENSESIRSLTSALRTSAKRETLSLPLGFVLFRSLESADSGLGDSFRASWFVAGAAEVSNSSRCIIIK
jgi:hypothetical protein